MSYYDEREQSRCGQKLALDMVIYSSMRNLPFAPVAQ